AADRLVYTCSSLESLLLKDMSEPIQQNLGERMAFLLTRNPTDRANIVGCVRQAYGMRSRYIHHRKAEIEESNLTSFTQYAYATLQVALSKLDNFKTSLEFLEEIDRIKFGG
ncbi:MAG TPA: hypothetical protein VMV54_01980, partial [Acidocella sp.]|nr:hypothetical protein [Acidocella sp.]